MAEEPHPRQIVVWDVPPAIVVGETFDVTLGVKCASECSPEGWSLEIADHEGREQATVEPGDGPWPGTTALYFARVTLVAPDAPGLYGWEVVSQATSAELAHAECKADLSVRVVPKPECTLEVVAVDAERQTPVPGAKVVVHPYRALTDEQGRARLKVPKGAFRLFVSGKNYFPFRTDGELDADLMIRAELAIDRGLSDADIWA